MRKSQAKPSVLWLLAGICLVWASLVNAGETATPKEFQAKLAEQPNGVVLDVRTPEEYAAGHLKAARNLNFYDDDFQAKLNALPKESTYFVYCKSGGRSGRTYAMMKEAGFQKVYDLQGGITQWQAEGLPVAK